MVYACTHNPEKGSRQQVDPHQHDNEVSQFTLFSQNTEFFIEHQPLKAGEESEFLVHLTDLSTYKPHLSGSVTILIDGVSVTSDQLHGPGIFEVPFIPLKAGAFHASWTFQSGTVTETVSVHIHVYQDHGDLHAEDEATQGHDHGAETRGEISFLKEQSWKNNFMVKEILPVPFSSVIHTSGEMIAVPGEEKNVVATSRGMVHFSNRNLVEGSPVTRGQHLFTLNSESMIENNVKLQYLESLNTLEKSRSEYERHKILYTQGAISERQFISTKSTYASDSLRFYSLAANTSEDGLRVYAPISGTIHQLNVAEGQYTETGALLVTISSNETLLIRADLSQQFYDQLDNIETANFRPASTDRVYSIEELNGSLLARGSSVAENDHYLPVIFKVENNGNLFEGAFTEVFLKSSLKNNVLVVPRTAISEEQGEHYVYVQVTGENYTKRSVSVGKNDGLYIEIISGLNPEERVVTKGVMLVKAASMVTGIVGQDHSH